jgi:hypothetical protein
VSFPQLPREPIRPELEGAESDKELWQPKWRCFCCQDNGLVNKNLVRLVIPDYDHDHDKWVGCQNPRCHAGSDYRGDPNYDQRFTVGICAELDRVSRDYWRCTIENQFELIQNRINDTATRLSFRKRDRTSLEETEATRRHEEASNADPEKLREMARAYLGDEYMKDGPS